MTTQIPHALDICRLIKEINSDCKIIWGGAHPSLFIKQTVSHPLVDIVVYGEGEITMNQIASNKQLSEIKGIAYKDGDRVIINDLQELHNPAETDLFNWNLMSKEILENLNLIPSLTSSWLSSSMTFCINAILKKSLET